MENNNLNVKEDQKKAVLCEVYSRVVGYMRPVAQWNKGKQEEFRERAIIDLAKTGIGENTNEINQEQN